MFSTPVGSRTDVLLIEDLSQQRLQARTLAAVLERAGLHAQIADLGESDSTELVALARREQPRLIVSSILFADRLPEHLRLVSNLRQGGVRAHLTLTGPLPALAYAELLTACPDLDSILCGESEATIAQLAVNADVAERWQTIEGIAYRSPSPRFNPLPRAVACLDDLPFPLHDAIPIHSGYGFATIEGSRGCYHDCTYCLPGAFYRALCVPYRLRSISNLVDEVEHLYGRGTRLFLFDDNQFIPPKRLRKERVTALGDELERRGLKIAFTIKCRADDVEAHLFDRLKEIGLVRVFIGVESGCQGSLDLFGKGVTPQRNAEALTILESLGIVADFRILIFHPWSTLESAAADIAFLEGSIKQVSTCFDLREVEIYPGTALARRLIAEGNCDMKHWPPSYTIQEPRLEILRRLNRFIFGARSHHRRIQTQVTRRWFDLLLLQRFNLEGFETNQILRLKERVSRLNRCTVDVWKDMLTFARECEIFDAERVNARAEAWVSRVNADCARLDEL